MKIDDAARYLFRPLLFLALGGIGNEVMLVLRALLWMRMGVLPPSVRWLGIEFASDPPRPPIKAFASEITEQAWQESTFLPSEQRLIALPDDCAEFAARIKAGETDISRHLQDMIPLDVIEKYSGSEAAQIPAFMRTALALCADEGYAGRGNSWTAAIESRLADLAPGGCAMHELTTRYSVPPSAIDSGSVTVVLLAGNEGGTGSGGLLPAGITVRWLAEKLGLMLRMHAVVLAGHYRPRDGQEERKSALGHALDLDVEYAMAMGTARADLSMPLAQEDTAIARGRLFDAVYRDEAAGRLEHDDHGILGIAAQTLLFRYFSREAFQMQRSRNNTVMTPRIRALAQERSWSPSGA